MELSNLDLAIILSYILVVFALGFILSRRAKQNLDHYFLGGNKIKWYFLGLSNASGMFDISGVMWTVTLLFVYGLKSSWIPWLWPVWNQVFVMVFLALWIRRSNVMTGASWIMTRFSGKGGEFSKNMHIVETANTNLHKRISTFIHTIPQSNIYSSNHTGFNNTSTISKKKANKTALNKYTIYT